MTPAGLRVDAARGRGGDGGGGEDGGGEGRWRFASKREEAVAVAVAEGSSAAWKRGSVVGQGGLDRARSWLRVTAHPAGSDARPRRRDRGHRRLCWGAARAARARAALFAARACLSRSRATAPCQRGRGGRCHTCARVCMARVGWRAARVRAWKHTCLEPGKRHRDEDGPSSSGRRADRLPLLLGQQLHIHRVYRAS